MKVTLCNLGLLIITILINGVYSASSPNRTVVFIYYNSINSDHLFIRGGIYIDAGCTSNFNTDACKVPIRSHLLGTTSTWDSYNYWRVNDNYLDWHGVEVDQGSFQSTEAEGTPMAWTSNDPYNQNYQELNTFGDNYWMVDMEMDCSLTQAGWFELKSYLPSSSTGWESDIIQDPCTGTVGGTPPYTTNNHMGLCGSINTFQYTGNSCQINAFTD